MCLYLKTKKVRPYLENIVFVNKIYGLNLCKLHKMTTRLLACINPFSRFGFIDKMLQNCYNLITPMGEGTSTIKFAKNKI